MLTLSADPAQVESLFGLNAHQSLLFSAIRLDSYPLVAPIVATVGDSSHLLVRQQEQGNAVSAGVPMEAMKFYAPWVTIDPRIVADTPASPSLASLVHELSDDGPVRLAPDLAYAHFLAFSGKVDLEVDGQEPTPVTAYEIDTDQVLATFRTWREEGAETAHRVIEGIDHLGGLESEFTTDQDSRFTALRALTDDHRLNALLLASNPNFTEATGAPQPDGAVAVWLPATARLLVLAPDGSGWTSGEVVTQYPSVGAAVGDLAPGGRIGVEEEWITVGLARELEQGVDLVPVSSALGHWRDVRDHEDLPFQVIAARTSVFAIEEALAWAETRLGEGRTFTELDIYGVYVDKIAEFHDSHEIPFAIKPYFTNLHSSNRMLLPGPPVNFPIDADTTCIQLDAGVRVECDGVTVATSDMARSLPRTAAAKEAYGFFFDVVREGIIGQLRPGVVCEDVHEGTMEYLAPHLDRMVEIGMLGTEIDFNTEYRKRNVGHLMGKQESFANELRPGYKHALHVGSYGAAEIPWRFGNAAIGTEDLWYIGRDRTYILSKRR